MQDGKARNWGGRRIPGPGKRIGPPIVHTNPAVRERTTKLRATDAEWEQFNAALPVNTREKFLFLLYMLNE